MRRKPGVRAVPREILPEGPQLPEEGRAHKCGPKLPEEPAGGILLGRSCQSNAGERIKIEGHL